MFIALIAGMAITSSPTQMDSDVYEVVSAQRIESYAGRLGMRIRNILTVQKDGKSFEVVLGRVHTRNTRHIATYGPGDRVRINQLAGDRIRPL